MPMAGCRNDVVVVFIVCRIEIVANDEHQPKKKKTMLNLT